MPPTKTRKYFGILQNGTIYLFVSERVRKEHKTLLKIKKFGKKLDGNRTGSYPGRHTKHPSRVIEQQSCRVSDFPEINVSVGLSEDALDTTELSLGRPHRVLGDHRSVSIDGILVEAGEL